MTVGPTGKIKANGGIDKMTYVSEKADVSTNNAFYGLAREWFRGDRLYKIYLTNETLVGIKVGGQFHDKLSVRVQLSPFYLTLVGIPFVEILASWIERRRLLVETEVEKDLAKAATRDDSLVVALSDLRVVELSSRPNWWTMGLNSGTVTFKRQNQDSLALVLTGNQDRERIGIMFRQRGIAVELK